MLILAALVALIAYLLHQRARHKAISERVRAKILHGLETEEQVIWEPIFPSKIVQVILAGSRLVINFYALFCVAIEPNGCKARLGTTHVGPRRRAPPWWHNRERSIRDGVQRPLDHGASRAKSEDPGGHQGADGHNEPERKQRIHGRSSRYGQR